MDKIYYTSSFTLEVEEHELLLETKKYWVCRRDERIAAYEKESYGFSKDKKESIRQSIKKLTSELDYHCKGTERTIEAMTRLISMLKEDD